MLTPRLRPYAWIVLLLSAAAALYCLAAVAMVASLSGAPNYVGDAHHQAVVWETAFVALLIVAGGAIVVLIRTRRSEK